MENFHFWAQRTGLVFKSENRHFWATHGAPCTANELTNRQISLHAILGEEVTLHLLIIVAHRIFTQRANLKENNLTFGVTSNCGQATVFRFPRSCSDSAVGN